MSKRSAAASSSSSGRGDDKRSKGNNANSDECSSGQQEDDLIQYTVLPALGDQFIIDLKPDAKVTDAQQAINRRRGHMPCLQQLFVKDQSHPLEEGAVVQEVVGTERVLYLILAPLKVNYLYRHSVCVC